MLLRPTAPRSTPGGRATRTTSGWTATEYERHKRLLQIELLKLQEWIKDTGERLVIVFEGRDAAGKGGTIKRFMEHLNPRGARVVALEKPTERERTQWYFQRYVQHLPAGRRDRAVRPVLVQPGRRRAGDGLLHRRASTWSSCGRRREFERMLVRSGIHLVKFWFSVSRDEQRTRFVIRQVDPVRQWKLSPDGPGLAGPAGTSTPRPRRRCSATPTPTHAPWTVIKSNDKKRARVEAMRHVLSLFEYDNKDHEIVGSPDPRIVVHATDLLDDDRTPGSASLPQA